MIGKNRLHNYRLVILVALIIISGCKKHDNIPAYQSKVNYENNGYGENNYRKSIDKKMTKLAVTIHDFDKKKKSTKLKPKIRKNKKSLQKWTDNSNIVALAPGENYQKNKKLEYNHANIMPNSEKPPGIAALVEKENKGLSPKSWQMELVNLENNPYSGNFIQNFEKQNSYVINNNVTYEQKKSLATPIPNLDTYLDEYTIKLKK